MGDEFYIALLFAVIFGGVGLGFILKTVRTKKRCSQKTRGVISRVDKHYDNENTEMKTLHYQFTVNGTAYSGTSKWSGTSSAKAGDAVDIYYNPMNPQDFYCRRDLRLNILVSAICLFVFGVTIAVAVLSLAGAV